jgi:D-alanyl-D-alanine carboxypeptidase/D-alanyl-D-alanine-endopeptidase (penicillin-binding protein 4)
MTSTSTPSAGTGRVVRVVTAFLIVLSLSSGAPAATKQPARKKHAPPRPIPMVWHVETLDGAEVTSLDGDAAINPASVVKVATTLWALEKLGPEHRFDTVVSARGEVDETHGILKGDLVVRGSGDPDFHIENAFLTAARLNQAGIKSVRGALRVNGKFWIGWEGGSERMLKDPQARIRQMAQRLRAAMDPRRWDASTRRAWRDFAVRYSMPITLPPAVSITGGADVLDRDDPADRVLFTHRSKPLLDALRRFDCFSNNDIERLGASLGSAPDLARRLTDGWKLPADAVKLETISGLGTNRMTPRLVVRLLRELKATTERLGLSVESVLPVAGCDPGTLNHSFAPLTIGENAMSVVAKTGTLTSTDGGTAVLAGLANTGKGDQIFCIAAPAAAGRLAQARRQELRWVQDLIARSEGPRMRRCMGPLRSPEDGVVMVPPAPASPSSAAAAATGGAGAR